MVMAPLSCRRRWASPALAGGASIILAPSVFGLADLDPRFGQSANESDRRFYLLFLACGIPVLALALISLRYFKWAFLPGLGNQPGLSPLYLTLIVIWLELFWHW